MKDLYSNAACGGMEVHYKFSNVTFCDTAGGKRTDDKEKAAQGKSG